MLYIITIIAAYLLSQGEYTALVTLTLTLIILFALRVGRALMAQSRRRRRREEEELEWQISLKEKITLTDKVRPQVLLDQERQRSWEALQAQQDMKAERRRAHAKKVAAKEERRRAHKAREAANRQRKAAKAKHADEIS
jgi:ABC-type multidrug transport system fused ATPase/permease subunit